MDDASRAPLSHLFMLRLWRVEAAGGRSEWLGKLQYVPSGETRYFRNWTAMITSLCALLPEQGLTQPGAGDQPNEAGEEAC